MEDKLTKTNNYSLLTSEIESGYGIEVFRVWNTYHDLPKDKKIEMIKTIMDWGMSELDKIKLSINSTSNEDMNIGVHSDSITAID